LAYSKSTGLSRHRSNWGAFQATLNEQPLPQWQAVEVKENDIITISEAKVVQEDTWQ